MFSYHIPLENGRRLASHDEYSNAQHIPSYPILALDADSTDLHLSTSPRLLTPTQHAAAHPPSNFSSTVHRPDTQITYPYPYFDSTFHVSQTPTGTQFIDGISGSNIYASEYETFPQSFSTEENSLLQPAPSFGGLSDRPSLQADFFVEDYCRITYPPPENSILSSWEVAPPAALQLSNGTLDHSNLSKNTCRHCNLPFSHAHGLTHHVRNAHTELFECQDCHESFSVTEHLNQHARQAKHQAFRCSASGCITRFTRLDDLHRHMRRHRPDAPQFACTLCPQKNFGRKDHLTQHMRNWHRVDQLPGTSTSSRSCPHPWCPRFREPDGTSLAPLPFNQSKDYIHHMRHEHNESPFPCLESGCDKIEGNGYFREMDLVKHRRKTHAHTEVMGGEG